MTVTSTISPMLKIGLQILGVWPGMSHSIYLLMYMPSALIIQYFQYLYVVSHFNFSELSNLLDSLITTLYYTLILIKLINLRIHRRIIYHILTTMSNDWRECINIEQHLYVMTIKASISHFYSNAMWSLNAITVIFYLFSGYAIHALHLVEDHNDTMRQLPIKLQLPFETEQSPIFEILNITLNIYGVLNVWIISVLNSLIFSLVLHVSGQIEIICQELSKIIPNKNSIYEYSPRTLGTLIERHNRVISFSDNMEEFLTFTALMEVVWNTLVICCIGFIIIISIHTEDGGTILVKTVFAYISIMAEIFIFCFAGEYLSFKSKSIADASYETLWYKLPLNQAKIISQMIMRSQKPLEITAGKFVALSLETFANIMKASVSYISVLYAMY